MKRIEKLLVVVLVMVLLLAIAPSQQSATAKPAAAITKYVGVGAVEFHPNDSAVEFDNSAVWVETTASGGILLATVNIPNGAKINKLTMYVKDVNATFEACPDIFLINYTTGDFKKRVGKCSNGSSTDVRSFTKTFANKLSKTKLYKVVVAVGIEGNNIALVGARVGYVK